MSKGIYLCLSASFLLAAMSLSQGCSKKAASEDVAPELSGQVERDSVAESEVSDGHGPRDEAGSGFETGGEGEEEQAHVSLEEGADLHDAEKSDVTEGAAEYAKVESRARSEVGKVLVSEEKKRAFRDYLSKVEKIPLDLQRLEQSVREKYGLLGIADPEEVLRELSRLHEAGDKTVIYDLGLYLAYGHASVIDPEAARYLFLEAVAEGDVRGLSALGNLYLNGIGVEQDRDEARFYYEQAFSEGDVEAGNLIGRGLREGRFGEVDLEEGKRYLVAAAEAGSQGAARALWSVVHEQMEEGKRKPEDYQRQLSEFPELESWLRRGVQEGNIDDILVLGRLYRGTGRFEEAGEVLKKGVESGSYEAAEDLLLMSVPRLFRESDTRSGFQEMFEEFAKEGSRREKDALFSLALIEVSKGREGADLDRAVALLKSSFDAYQPKSKLALLKIENGEHPAKAVLSAARLSKEKAYAEANVLAADMEQGVASDRPPTVRKMPNIEYPYEITKEAIEGRVLVELIVDSEGKVQRPRILESSHQIFEEKALEAAVKIQFDAAIKDGKAVAAKVRVPIQFKPSEGALVPAVAE